MEEFKEVMEKVVDFNSYKNEKSLEENETPDVQQEIIEDNKIFQLLDTVRHFEDYKVMKDELISNQLKIIDNKDILDVISPRIKDLTIEQIKELTDEEVENIYVIDGTTVEITLPFEKKEDIIQFKRDFLIYKKNTDDALDKIEEATVKMEEELKNHQEELNKAIAEYGDVSAFIRKKLDSDYEKSDNPFAKEKIAGMIKYFDAATDFNFLIEYYKKTNRNSVFRAYGDETKAAERYQLYRKVIAKLNLKTDLTGFPNFEKRFLEEEYHKFDNLFLYSIVHYYAFNRDMVKLRTDGVFLSQLVVNLKEIYSGRMNQEKKEIFLDNVRKFLKLFY